MGRVAAPALESQLVLFGEVRDMLCRRRGVLALGAAGVAEAASEGGGAAWSGRLARRSQVQGWGG